MLERRTEYTVRLNTKVSTRQQSNEWTTVPWISRNKQCQKQGNDTHMPKALSALRSGALNIKDKKGMKPLLMDLNALMTKGLIMYYYYYYYQR